ncbi:condensin-2 complex subunit D3-like isoform X2 [Venturia canescens]|uniref:condensin-2 complex subunit D3-like isoform X2 n=1 Tax=Venturia canescens TaxID=32260 RepID=UPI001C9CEA1B|nr:condensin-2 complex subunit D3-like isoform X2 [Venturia canescens]
MESLHGVFDSFKLDELDQGWINQVYGSAFSNVENVPIDYLVFLESSEMMELLKDACNVVKSWISNNGDVPVEKDEVSWETLIAMNFEIQSLLSVLAYLMKNGQSFDASQDSRQSCLRATSLYFVLLTIPGSNAFQAFQPNLYEVALKSLELSQRLAPREKNTKRCNFNNSENSTNNVGSSDVVPNLSNSQSIALTRGLNAVVYDLVTMLKSTCTSMEIRLLETTIYYLVEITKLAEEAINPQRSKEATLNSLAYNAYVALEQICNPKYAAVPAISRIIAKYMLPQFLVSATNLSPKQVAMVRESTMYFFNNLLAIHGKEVQSALIILLQHIMMKCPDKVDGRQKQAAIIIRFFYICCNDESSLKECLKYLVHLCHHNKIYSRIFAQEIVGKFIMELSASRNHREEENSEILRQAKVEQILLACAMGRCFDVSSMVRGRAMATLAEYTDSVDRLPVRKIFQNQLNGQTRKFLSLEIIEDCMNNENLDALLPDTEETIAMLKDRLEDERALVRRSTLQVLCNGILISPELLDNLLPLIRQRCRDSILTVRRYAIRILTNLLEEFPDKAGLCEDWVDSVVPRVFDSEAKVQEEVLAALEKLTINRITAYNPNNPAIDLPWRILNEIAINKMGDHLTKACSVWLENNLVNDKKIAIIKSHIGMYNNMGAWLLLASISENKKLSGMQTYYTFYGRSLVDSDHSDVYLASLMLRVLHNSWSTFDDLTLQQISKDITNYLKTYRVKVPLIRHSLDILLDITKYLERINNETRTIEESEITRELVRLSETTITRVVESDLPESSKNLLFRAVCTLGHASFLSWSEISKDVRRILQRFLLEWNNLPHWVRDKNQLQGAAVTVLGQQSLINRDIAVEMTPIFGYLLCNKSENLHRQTVGDSQQASDTNFDKRRERLNYENMANGPVVRINAAKALADICSRFTALVEPYLTDMCISMKDPNPEVRQVILVLFIQLLVEDTIMIKEAFFFYILTMLADDDSTIRQMTVFLIKERLLAKNKNLITQQLLNGIYHFNDYERRSSVKKRRRRVDQSALSLTGNDNEKKRQTIYDFMLENLDSPGKLSVVVKLTKHILNPRSNDRLDVRSEKGISLIRDTLYIITSDHLQSNSRGIVNGCVLRYSRKLTKSLCKPSPIPARKLSPVCTTSIPN